jgi:hypothetical protein
MPAVSQKINNLIGGVSQQPDPLKLEGTFVSCDDWLPDPLFGLSKRPGIKHISQLNGALSTSSSWGFIDRDDEEKYLVQIGRTAGSSMLKVWDAQSGEAQVVNAIGSGAQGYLAHTDDAELELLTVGDYTLLLNKKVNVTQGSLSSPTDIPYAIISINAIGYSSRYEFTLKPSTLYTYTTAHSSGSTILSIRDVTEGLASVINAGGILTATVIGPYLYVRRADGGSFDASTQGGQGGSAISIAKGKVASPAELPRQFINNARIQILSNEGSDGDDYWVTFKTDSGATSGVGVWEETIGPGVNNGFNTDTLPHALIREANGTFTVRRLGLAEALATLSSVSTTGTVTAATVLSSTRGRYLVGQTFWARGNVGTNLRLRVASTDASGNIVTVEPSRAGYGFTASTVVSNEFGDTFTITAVATVTTSVDPFAKLYWVDRQAGDIKSNSWPSFKDNPIDGISFFKNRLVLSSQDNIITSVAGNYFNFFQTTVATILASDPVDISAGSTRPLRFRRMLPYQRGLLCFSDNGQYSLETNTEAFSTATAEMVQVGSYDMLSNLAPIDIGPSIVFASRSTRATSVFEAQFTAEGQSRTRVAELTRVIPRYLPPDIQDMKASTTASLVALRSKQAEGQLFCFKFYDVGGERKQAAWFRWMVPGLIEHQSFSGNVLTVVLRSKTNPATLSLASITIDNNNSNSPLFFQGEQVDVRLDLHSYNPSIFYNVTNDTTEVGISDHLADYPGQTWECVTTSAVQPGVTFTGTLINTPSNPVGRKWHLSVPGDLSNSTFCIGMRIQAEATLPAFFITGKDEKRDTRNIPVIHRLTFSSFNSGSFQVRVNSQGRDPFTATLEQKVAGIYVPDTIPIARNRINTVPVFAKGDATEIKIVAPYLFPVTIDSILWEGTYDTFGQQRL